MALNTDIAVGSGNRHLYRLASAIATNMPVTMACWAKITHAPMNAIYTLVSVLDASDNTQNFQLQIDGTLSGDPVTANTQAGGVRARGESATGVTLNKWHHCAAVFEGSSGTITSRTAYIDGVAGTPETTSHLPSGLDRTNIGAEHGSSYTEPLIGEVVWAAIWDTTALTAAEILRLAKSERPDTVAPANLLDFKRFDLSEIPTATTDGSWTEEALAVPVTGGGSWTGGIATLGLVTAPTTWAVGDFIRVTGVTPSGYDTLKARISAISGNDFSYPLATDPGTYTSGGSMLLRLKRSIGPFEIYGTLRNRPFRRDHLRPPSYAGLF